MDHMEEERYMQNENVIRKNDFEKYEILVPFRKLTGRRKEQFLCSELEKKHPCFSDEFTFDSIVKSISRKGMVEHVFVMNKIKLAEYERKRSFPSVSGTGFCIEKEKRMKRLFVNKRVRFLVYAVSVFFLILLLGLIGSLSGKKGAESKSSAKIASDEEMLFQPQSALEETLSDDAELDDWICLAASLFTLVSESDGKIKRFDWSIENQKGGGYEKIESFITGVFPENTGFFSAGSVIYEKGRPQMTLSYKRQVLKVPVKNDLSSIMSNSDFNKSLRMAIASYGAVLKEEKAPPYHITFITDGNRTSEAALLDEIAQLLSEAGRRITAISINPVNENDFCFGLTIENDFEIGFDLRLLSDYFNLFSAASGKQLQTKSPEKDLPAYEEKQKKIGEIKKTDNTVVVFYKNEEGKIVTKIKESEVN